MLQLTPQMRILVGVEPQDFRCGIDGMARVCRQHLLSDPFLCVGCHYVAAASITPLLCGF